MPNPADITSGFLGRAVAANPGGIKIILDRLRYSGLCPAQVQMDNNPSQQFNQ